MISSVLSPESIAGPNGTEVIRQMRAAREFLMSRSKREMLELVGKQAPGIRLSKTIDKAVTPDSYFGGSPDVTDDLLAGFGLFYITEQGKVFLDTTAGHYQMTWGYSNPMLEAAAKEAMDAGVVWDNHANVPQWPNKRLAQKLIQLANPERQDLKRGDFSQIIKEPGVLNVALIGIATGSVACETALKISLIRHKRVKNKTKAVMLLLDGNYHGTGIAAQYLRGMWPEYISNITVVSLQPNDYEGLEAAFREHGEDIAAFWAEPVMMNREAILVEGDYLRRARELTEQYGAQVIIDEIQSGFWVPEMFMYRQYGITPDIVIVGKGLTAGLHPLSGVLFRKECDFMAQYDALNTNGYAALASYVALANLAMVEADYPRIGRLHEYYENMIRSIAADFPKLIKRPHGKGLLSGLKFFDVETVMPIYKQCVDQGLWLRVHGYHPGHCTILSKFALCVDEEVMDFMASRLREILSRA